jgi:hypothetical protein
VRRRLICGRERRERKGEARIDITRERERGGRPISCCFHCGCCCCCCAVCVWINSREQSRVGTKRDTTQRNATTNVRKGDNELSKTRKFNQSFPFLSLLLLPLPSFSSFVIENFQDDDDLFYLDFFSFNYLCHRRYDDDDNDTIGRKKKGGEERPKL